MRELSVVMENLRLVQRAQRRFMDLWAVEQQCIIPMLDRVAEDLRRDENVGDVPAGLNPPSAPDE